MFEPLEYLPLTRPGSVRGSLRGGRDRVSLSPARRLLERAEVARPGPEGKEGVVQLRLIEAAPPAELQKNPVPRAERRADRREITGHKGSIFYRAHAYHTKVPPEGIARLIEHYTDPGDLVVDPFAGSGMTGVACLLTGRRGVLSDLSPAAVHIARNYVTPADADMVVESGDAILGALAALEEELYRTTCRSCGQPAVTEYVVWSDVFACPACRTELLFWSAALSEDRREVRSVVPCSSCGKTWRKTALRWLRAEPVHVSASCRSCSRRTEGPAMEDEQIRILSLTRDAIASWYPTAPFESWREMWRGQHRDQAIDTAADFFTNRNLWALARLSESINDIRDPRTRDALRYVFTAIVNRASRRYQWNPKRPTNVLTSTLYIASLSYEFNVFSLFRRKLKTAGDLFRTTANLPGRAEVKLSPAQSLGWIPDGSVDYVFTDPPFGSNIFYSDASFLWEAWLDDATNTTYETVVHKSQHAESGGKDLDGYEKLMTGAFTEIERILRPGAWASVMFHNSSDEVWSALVRALEVAGFEIGAAVAFDKSQPSFKAIKGRLAGERVPSFDLVLHLRRRNGRPHLDETVTSGRSAPQHVEAMLLDRLGTHLATAPSTRRTTPYVHSLVMRVLLEEELPLQGFTYQGVEEFCQRHFSWDGSGWRLPGEGNGRA